jgi:hypothetical protein
VARRRRGGPPARGGARLSGPRPEQVEEASDGDWVVRSVMGAAASGLKTYRCPGCVTWPAYARDSDLEPWDTESAADQRRHWHTTCWRARDRRR